jgi:hypothetical protein
MHFQFPVPLPDRAAFHLRRPKKSHHSGESRQIKIMSDTTDPVIMIDKRKLELFGKHMEREEDGYLFF